MVRGPGSPRRTRVRWGNVATAAAVVVAIALAFAWTRAGGEPLSIPALPTELPAREAMPEPVATPPVTTLKRPAPAPAAAPRVRARRRQPTTRAPRPVAAPGRTVVPSPSPGPEFGLE